jgi:hypothetical protein
MAANGHGLWCSTRKLSASPKSTTAEAALGRQLQECPFRETKRPSHGTAPKGSLQYSQFCQQEYSTAALVSFPMDFTGFTEYRLTMKRLATRIDARSRDTWPAVLMDHFWCGLPRRSGNGDLLNFLRGLAARNSQDELGLVRLRQITTRTLRRSMLACEQS